jgi:hypothetical protein
LCATRKMAKKALRGLLKFYPLKDSKKLSKQSLL